MLIYLIFFIYFPFFIEGWKIGYQQNSEKNLQLLNSGAFDAFVEDLSGQFEGDMILNKQQVNFFYGGFDRVAFYNGKIGWSWSKEIPYKISPKFSNENRKFVENVLKSFRDVSCIQFIPYTNERDFIYITNEDTGCHSYVGRQINGQTVNLQGHKIGSACLIRGKIIHESLHALGFFHMHTVPGRDDYVTVKWDKIQEKRQHNFKIKQEVNMFGEEYDVRSVMHYSPYSFAKVHGDITMEPKDSADFHVMGQRKYFSDSDIIKLNKMYKC